MQRKEINTDDRRTKNTRRSIRDSLIGLLKTKPYQAVTVSELCRIADINRATFYLHYSDVNAVLEDILCTSFTNVSGTIEHVLCPQKETCTYPFCQKIQENEALWPLFLDDTVSDQILKHLAKYSKESFVDYLMQRSDLSYEQAESIFYFQINGCLTINRLMLKNNCKEWQSIQHTVDRFIRAGLQEFLQDEK